eukprot:CAMPEP_0182419250 /NCGR_PEP_ID=MMETSP1167-20130531/3689_1 /TAXON_ID=2988 /ORGANISM="Mallomonas Sp, Strain CCMP3275" /LENGTH=265 /DNA_ID=CAMNT_0024594017 /DNA_START=49 /DNA_END=846 /DNA_ORIENTATION=-
MIGLYIFALASSLVSVESFVISGRISSRQLAIFSDSTGSPLPTFDGLVNDDGPKRVETKPVADTPLVERALDSALDFLQDGEVDNDEDDEDDFDMFQIFEDSPDFEVNYDLIRELEDKEAEAIAAKVPSAAEVFALKVQAAVEKWRKHDKDVGSMEVQVAISNERIRYLTTHLLKNKKDKAAKRGLDKLVVLRKECLNYLYEHDRPKAEEMVTALGIRYRPPGRLWDKQAKYKAFKNTKSKYQRLRMLARQERDARAARNSEVKV